MLGLIVGTGPSLRPMLPLLRKFKGLVFAPNNVFEDVRTDVWLACDPAWHRYYSPVRGDFDKWHWDSAICNDYGYKYVEGIWHDGLWMDSPDKISLGHCSGHQLLNLAANQYGCDTILLVGHDFSYPQGEPRHYFTGLSSEDGEYPSEIRKFSKFIKPDGNDLLAVYKKIADQKHLPPIINCTPGSALPWFPKGELKEYL